MAVSKTWRAILAKVSNGRGGVEYAEGGDESEELEGDKALKVQA